MIEKQSLDARVDELNTAGNPALAIKSVWSRDPKVIDGSISSPEWYVARNHTTFPAPNTGTFWAENDQMYMYLGLNIQDRDLPDINTIAFVFDTGNDGAFATGGEPMFQYMPAQQLLVYASITSFMGMGTMQELPDGCAAVSAQSGDDTRFEMQVPLSVLDTAPGGYVGIFMMYMLNTGGTPNFYPANPFDIGAWPAIQLSMPDMGSPLLADETFLPAAPPYYTNMSYTFSVNYSDPDNNAPNAISVVIDGESVRLDQENLLDTDYMDGAIFSCDVALGAGTHEYYFQTIQGLNDIRLPGTSNLTTPFITHVNNKAPTLSGSGVNLPSGDNFTVFIFTTTYKDEDNNAPVEVNVNIDGIPHPMEPLVQSSGPTNYIAGVTYAHETQLGAGSHEYYFSCNDGTFAARDPPATNYTGPAVIAGSPSALFDGLYLTASIPFGLLGTFTQMRYDYELLPNGTYAGGVWGYFVDWMLVETFNEDPDTGMVSSVVYYTGGPGGGPMVNGMRDPVWIQKNATLGSSYFLALGGAPVLWTVTGESWCTYGVHNRSCWVLTDGSGSYALYDKQTGVVLEMYVITSTPPVTSEVLDTNALDFHAPAISSVIISPSSGDGTTLFTFGALVKDLDGIGPKGVDLVLDGVSFPMQPATGYPGVEDWVNGVNHTLSMYLESGMHEYHVLASGSRYSARYPPSSNLTISVSANNDNAPALTNGRAIPFGANDYNIIVFMVTYNDADNNPPGAINVTVDGTPWTMAKHDPSDMNLMDGCLYVAQLDLPPGNYSYYFQAHDGGFSARYPSAGSINGSVATTPRQALFNGAEMEILMEMYGVVNYTFTEVNATNWRGFGYSSTVGTYIENTVFNNETLACVEGSGPIGGSASYGTQTMYFVPQDLMIGDQIVMYENMGAIYNALYNVTGVDIVTALNGQVYACWKLIPADGRDVTLWFEQSTGLVIKRDAPMIMGGSMPVIFTLIGTNIINDYTPEVTVHEASSGTLLTSEPVVLNMTYQDGDCFRPAFITLNASGTIFDLTSPEYVSGDDWGAGVDIYFEQYLPPGSYTYHVEWSDGTHAGRYPIAGEGSFTVVYVNDFDPVLSNVTVSPGNVTHNYTTPLYFVTYQDADNNPPSSVEVTIDGLPYLCSQYGSSTNYVDGVPFYYLSPPLTEGVHNYSFYAEDDGARWTDTPLVDGPLITPAAIAMAPFDGMVLNWRLYAYPMSYTGTDTYTELVHCFNVTQRISSMGATSFSRYETETGMALMDETAFRLQDMSDTWLWQSTTVTGSPNDTVTITDGYGGGPDVLTYVGITPYFFNGEWRPAWIFSNGGDRVLQVDQHTGLALQFTFPYPSIMYYWNYTLLSSNAFDDHVPLLSAGGVNQPSGPTTSPFTFTVNVTDMDGLAPDVILVVDGKEYPMNRYTGTDYKAQVTFTTTIYLQQGTRNYHFEARDHHYTASTPAQNITVTGGNVALPVLASSSVTPRRGDNYTVFEFVAVYQDTDNNAPVHMVVDINGTSYAMEQVNPLDTNYMDGSNYYWKGALAADAWSYTYSFVASDDMLSFITSPSNGSYEDLIVRAGDPCVLADDVGYAWEITMVPMGTAQARYLYFHDVGNNYTAYSNITGFMDGLGGFTVNNLTRMMDDYFGPVGNIIPAGNEDAVWILRNVSIGDNVSMPGPGGSMITTVDRIETISRFGKTFDCWVLVGDYVIGYYDMETGFMLVYLFGDPANGYFFSHAMYGTMFDNHYQPSLSGATFLNATGNATVPRYFEVTYQDGDNVLPGRHDLVINGTFIPMQEVDPLDVNVADGKVYAINLYLSPADYAYHLRFSDNMTTVYALNGTFTVDYANAFAPVLNSPAVTPTRGYNGTIFTFEVTYSDADNNAPSQVLLTLDGDTLGTPWYIPMGPVNPLDTNYMDGALFQTWLALDEGNYVHNFTTDDGVFTANAPVAGAFTGPRVKNSTALFATNMENITIGIISHYYGGNDPWNNFGDIRYDLQARNASVSYLEGPLTAEYLESVNIIWIYYLNTPLSIAERDLLLTWIEEGGCLMMVGPYFNTADMQLVTALGLQQRQIPSSVSGYFTNEISLHPVTTSVTQVYFDWVNRYMDISGASIPFESVVDVMGYDQVIVHENDAGGKIIVVNDEDIFYYDWIEPQNAILYNNMFGWLARYNQFDDCSVSGLGYLPATPNNTAPVTFRALFTDPDDYKPVFIEVVVDGTHYPMHKQTMDSYSYDTGEVYTCDVLLQDGTYSYYIVASDGASLSQTAPTPITVALVDLFNPTVAGWVITSLSHEYTNFAFIAEYTDPDNNGPQWLWIYIDGGAGVPMQELDPADDLYLDGKRYYYNTTLGFGTHTYYFRTTDDGVTIVRSPAGTDTFNGPTVIDHSAFNVFQDGLVYEWTWNYNWGGSDDFRTVFSVPYGATEANVTTYFMSGDMASTMQVDVASRQILSYSSWGGPWLGGGYLHFIVPVNLTTGTWLDIGTPDYGWDTYQLVSRDLSYINPLGQHVQCMAFYSSWSDTSAIYDQKTGLLIATYRLSSGSSGYITWCDQLYNEDIPVLVNGTVVPPTGTQDQQFEFSIDYFDAGNNTPNTIVTIVNGTLVLPMTKVNPLDTDYTDGCSYHVQIHFQPGTYAFEFLAMDGLFTAHDDGGGSYSFLVGYTNVNVPSLSGSAVVPLAGYNYTAFRFTTTYTDVDNNAPVWVTVEIPGMPNITSMSQMDPGDTNYMDGAVFYVDAFLPEGYYEFAMNASDGAYAVRDPPVIGTFYSGPNATGLLPAVRDYVMVPGYPYSWEDTGNGTVLPIIYYWDYQAVSLPFTFTMYDQAFTNLIVSGDIFLRMGNSYYDWWCDSSIPSTHSANQYIMGVDTTTPIYSTGGYVRYQYLTGPDRFVIEYGNLHVNWDPDRPLLSMQYILYGTGEIVIQFQTYNYSWGSVFLNNGNGINYNEFSGLNEFGYNNWAVMFYYPPDDPFPPTLSVTTPGNASTYYSTTVPVELETGSPDIDRAWFNVWDVSGSTYLYPSNISYTFGSSTPVTIGSTGVYELHAWANDTHGNMAFSSTQFTVDLSVPEAYITSPLSQTYTTTTLTLTITWNPATTSVVYNVFNLTGASWVWGTNQTYTGSGPLDLSEGMFIIYAWGMNGPIPQPVPTTCPLSIDLSPPVLFISSPTNNTWYTTPTIPLNYTTFDMVSGIDSTWFNFWDADLGAWVYGSNQTYTGYTTRVLQDGAYTFHAWARDDANFMATSSREIVVNALDPVADQPADIVCAQNQSGVTITWHITEALPNEYQVLRNGSPITPWTAYASGTPITIPADTDIGLGIWNYTINYNDAGGRNGTPDTVFVDVRTGPSATSQPVGGIRILQNSTYTINWTLTSAIGAGQYRVLRGGVPYIGWTAWVTSPQTIPVPALTNIGTGNVTYTIEYTDSLGNFGTPSNVWIAVNDYPFIPSPPADRVITENATGQVISWRIYDYFGGFGSYTVYQNGVPYSAGGFSSGSYTNVSIQTSSGLGTWNYTIQYRDTYNAWGIQDVVIITINDHPVILSPPDDDMVMENATAFTGWTITDAVGGDGAWRVLLDGSPITAWNAFLSGDPIVIQVNTDIGLGPWSYTIEYNDTYGLAGISDEVIITVNDYPTISSPPPDRTITENATLETVSWTIFDTYGGFGSFNITLNGTSILTGGFISGLPGATVNVETNIGWGDWNYSVTYWDMYNAHGVQDDVIITINDHPRILSPPGDRMVAENATGEEVEWTITDVIGGDGFYRASINGTPAMPWVAYSSGVTVGISVLTDSGPGTWFYTIEYNDTHGVMGTADEVIITVNDFPKIPSPPADRMVAQNSTGQVIEWTIEDVVDGTGTYQVLLEGSPITGVLTFTSGIPVHVDIETDSGLGVWNYTIEFWDDYGYAGTPDTVLIDVTPNPVASSEPYMYGMAVQNSSYWINWTLTSPTGAGQYHVLLNDSTYIDWTAWGTNPGYVNVSVNTSMGLGFFNYTIEYNSSTGLFGEPSTVIMLVNDVPSIPSPPPSVRVVTQNATGQTISWTIVDDFDGAGFYQVLVDGVPLTPVTSFMSGIPNTVDINTSIGLGTFVYTIMYVDTYGLLGINHEVTVTVNDVPTVNEPVDMNVLAGSVQSITWTFTDLVGTTGFYRVMRNGTTTVVGWTPINNGGSAVASILTGDLGWWEYTIEFNDTYGITGIPDSVLVIVNDVPDANDLVDVQYAANDTGRVLTWIVSDFIGGSGSFEVTINGLPHDAGSWNHGIPIIVDIDTDRGFGTWTYVLTYNDSFGIDGASKTVHVDIVDIPRSTHPGDQTVLQNATGLTISWTITDATGPGQYRVSRNGTVVVTWTPWTNATPFSAPVQTNVGFGTWRYTLEYNNSAGETGTPDDVDVLVDDMPVATPAANPAAVYQNTTGPTISWTITDRFGTGSYRILRNGTAITSWLPWTNNTAINHVVSTIVGTGTFTYTLGYNDSNGFVGSPASITATIMQDTVDPTISNPSIDSVRLFTTPVHVFCNATDAESGVNTVQVYYSVNGTSNFTPVTMTLVSGTAYSGEIPQQGFGSRVYYFFRATDRAGRQRDDNNGSNYYSYFLNFLQPGAYSFEFTTPVHIIANISVISSGSVNLGTFAAAPLLSTVNMTTILEAFDFSFTGGFSDLKIKVYFTPGAYQASEIVISHELPGGWFPVTPIAVNVAEGYVVFDVDHLSRFVVGVRVSGGGGGFNLVQFIQDNWLLLAIVGIGLVIGIGGAVAASKRKKKVAAATTTKQKGKATTIFPEQGKVVQTPAWVQAATTTPLTTDEVKNRIKHLFVFHSKTGVCLYYHPFAEQTIDPQLVAGFISAISSFGSSFEQDAELHVLEWKSFKILLEETATCKYALLFTGDMNEKLNELLKAFIGEFESKFRKSLQEFNGNVSIFNFAKEVMENVFKMKTQHVEKPAGQGTGALKQPDVVAKEPFHLYCAACEQWFIKQANAMVHGTESCTKCHQPLFFVPKCDNCGHALIKHVREFNDFKANPQNCERCGAKLRIQ